MADADASPSAPDAGSNKRRRIALACSTCRTRKSKCDGARPRCSACVALDFDCSYVQSSSSANVIVGKEYLTSLESRVARVEERLNHFESDKFQTSRSSSPVLSQPPAVDEEEGHTDAIGALHFAEEEDFAYLGPSSNIAFSRHLRPALARISRAAVPGATPDGPAGGSLLRSSRPPSPSSDHHGLTNTSPEADELRLIDDFFSNTGLIFPFIHERTFRLRYHDMRQDQTKPVQKSWLALLNMVLAFAVSASTRTDFSAIDRQRESDAFYRRALHLSRGQMMRCSSLETVQLLLLMSQYLQGTQKSLQTFIVHGLAVKGAFQLGLHSKEASLHLSPTEREFRKRTWYGIVTVDRTMSMTFGRPASVPDDYVRLDLPVLERMVDPTLTENTMVKDMSVSFFNATITLYNIMYTTVKTCYGGNLGCSDASPHTLDVVTRIYGLEKQLQEWKASLPPALSLRTSAETPNPSDSEAALNRARTILALRYLNLRILVNRPIVVELLDAVGRPEDPQSQHALVRQVGTNNLATCISLAVEIIAIVSTTVRSSSPHKRLLGAWWFTLYYTFNAALVLCAALVIRLDYRDGFAGDNGMPASPSSSEMRASFDAAIEALALLDRRNKTVDRCAQHLRGLGAALDGFVASRDRDVVHNGGPVMNAVDVTTGALMMARWGQAGNGFVNEAGAGGASGLGDFLADVDSELLSLFFQ
ncbi:fungal-specific transcription factor domain-containing protein [Phyllosticta capitalensis]